jgi:hypothetical protein
MTRFNIKIPVRNGVARTYPGWWDWPAYVVPYRWRWFHHLWANAAGFFWLPCPICKRPFGGHEWRDIDGKVSCIPVHRETNLWESEGICPQCTRNGYGRREWG